MKLVIPNVIDNDDLSTLAKERLNRRQRDWENPVISKVVEALREHTEIEIQEESYWVIESKPKGHEWHVDTGSNNHMPWCKFGCTTLLTNPDTFEGGILHYRDEEIEPEQFTLYGHTSDVEHMVTPSQPVKKRIVLLLFI